MAHGQVQPLAIPRTAQGAIDRARWRELRTACEHAVERFTVEGRDGLICSRCKLVLFF